MTEQDYSQINISKEAIKKGLKDKSMPLQKFESWFLFLAGTAAVGVASEKLASSGTNEAIGLTVLAVGLLSAIPAVLNYGKNKLQMEIEKDYDLHEGTTLDIVKMTYGLNEKECQKTIEAQEAIDAKAAEQGQSV